MNKNILNVDKLSKHYGGVAVVDQVSFSLAAGTIKAVLGENGAGKSTLMKILTGEVQADSGTIELAGKQVAPASPRSAAALGISMVHQELHLVPELSVADNLMLVSPPDTSQLKRGSSAERLYVEQQLQRVGLDVSTQLLAGKLSAAQAQLLEIAKALALDTKILILDEPTSALPAVEADRVLAVVEGLRDVGHAILYISHHLSEVMRIADTLTVLRDGRYVGEFVSGQVETQDLVKLMVDRPVSLYHSELSPAQPECVLSVQQAASEQVDGLNFDLHRGEILGFAGLIGSGAHAAGHLICAASPLTKGKLLLHGNEIVLDNPYRALQAGIVLLPEERKTQSIVADSSVHDNLHLGRMALHARYGLLTLATMHKVAEQAIQQFNIRLRSLMQAIVTLSGGNQQKTVLARCIQSRPDVLILAEPTRGIDIAAKDEIHKYIISLAAEGMSIVLISSEMEEVIALSHRVAVFSKGSMIAVLAEQEISAARIMTLATMGQ